VLGGFALATLLLASAGVYGVMSFSTSQRTQEFRVRLALGATGRDIIGLVLGEGLKLTGVGVMIGVGLALLLARFVRQLLFGVTASDPLTFAVVTLTLVAIAAAASYLPASRALKIDPSISLRVD
jgi:putative ABC transport system permease protein